jgi:di/tricarboxylate transporter
MTVEIAFVLALFVIALVLFATEVLRVDVIGVMLLVALVIGSQFGLEIMTAKEALAAFGDETVLLLIGDFMLTIGLVKTGVTAEIGRRMFRFGSNRPALLIPILLLVACGISAWISNTVCTAVFLPIAIGLAQRLHISPSKVLMPLAFAVILGGNITLIGTSTNLVISGRLTDHGMPQMWLFEVTPVGLAIAAVGLVYVSLVVRRILPERHRGRDLTVDYKMRDYLSELLVLPTSRLVGRALRDAGIGEKLDLNVLGIIRTGEQILAPAPDLRIAAGDLLLVEGKIRDLMRVKDVAGIDILADVKLNDPDLTSAGVEMVEIMLMPGCWLVGRTLREAHFRERQGLTVLAINHHGGVRRRMLSATRLRAGDVMLVQGPSDAVERVSLDRNNFLVLADASSEIERTDRAGLALTIFVAMVVFGSIKLLPFSIAFLLGVVLMFVTGCLTPEEAYRGVNWEMMVLIACMIGFGDAMERSHAAEFIANLIVTWTQPFGDLAVLTAFFFLTTLLTQPMSNQAAALVVLPIGVSTAATLGINPRALALVVTFAASCSFLTPLEPSCIMVYGPGRYRFRDFVVAGAGLTVAVYIVTVLLVPVFWPLR